MSRKRFLGMNCAVAQTLEQVGDWWTLLIVRDALLGLSRFHEFEESLGISKNVLSDRIHKLVDHGIFAKHRLHEPGERFEYTLTRKGKDLWVVITALRLWSDKWIYGKEHVPLIVRERGTGRTLTRLVAVDERGDPLDASKLESVPGPGFGWEVSS